MGAPHCTDGITAGDVLVSHPLSCLHQTVFDKKVVLLSVADSCSHRGHRVVEGLSEDIVVGEGHPLIEGVVTNSPTGATLEQMLERWPNEDDKSWIQSLDLSGELLSERLYRGGPVLNGSSLRDSLRWAHVHGDHVDGAQHVARSLWLGGDLAQVVARSRIRAANGSANGKGSGLRFFLGFAAWSPPQLAVELECGVWVRAKSTCCDESAVAPPGEDDALLSQLCLGSVGRDEAWRVRFALLECMPWLTFLARPWGTKSYVVTWRRARGEMLSRRAA